MIITVQNERNLLYAGNLKTLYIAAALINTASAARVIVFQFKGIRIPAFPLIHLLVGCNLPT